MLAQNKMYWTDLAEHGIFRANLDGSEIETLIQVDSLYPVDITLDLEEGTFYWISDHSGYVFKSNLDGTGTELLNTTSQEALASIVVDPVNEKLYWSDWGRDRIQRANLDGSSIETIAFINLSRPWDLSLDLTENKIYWTELGKHAIYRANLDGSESELVTELGDPSRLAIDSKDKKVYWFDSENYKLVRANFDGGFRETLLETQAVFPNALAIDSRNESLYWNDIFYANLLTASMDGGDVQEISITGNSSFLGQSLRSSSSLLIDESQNKIFWIGPGFPSGVVQANLDGTMAEQLVAVQDDFALQSIALDPPRNQIYWIDRAIKSYDPITYGYWFNRASLDDGVPEFIPLSDSIASGSGIVVHTGQQKMYWANPEENIIQRANLDGSEVEGIVIEIESPRHIALDPIANKLYWSNFKENKIQRANLDGSDIEDVLEAFSPGHIALRLPFDTSTDIENEPLLPHAFDVANSYPNPFRTETRISYGMHKPGELSIVVYNALGREVAELENTVVQPGRHEVMWDGKDNAGAQVPAGLYIVRFRSDLGEAKAITLIKMH